MILYCPAFKQEVDFDLFFISISTKEDNMKTGIIGGSGLYRISSTAGGEEQSLQTPFGSPSAPYYGIERNGHTFYFLPRHGVDHHILPSEINHRANIHGFKQLGVQQIIAISAVGSLQMHYRPKDMVVVDQYVDRTKASERHTFFGKGAVAHIAFAEPICPRLRTMLFERVSRLVKANPDHAGIQVHHGGTYVNMEGPAFSTKAESQWYHRMGFDVIGMTTLAEAKLAREAELCFACLSMVTDYDSWHEDEEAVNANMVLQTLHDNVSLAHEFIADLLEQPPSDDPGCSCHHALDNALMTKIEAMPPETRQALQTLIGRF